MRPGGISRTRGIPRHLKNGRYTTLLRVVARGKVPWRFGIVSYFSSETPFVFWWFFTGKSSSRWCKVMKVTWLRFSTYFGVNIISPSCLAREGALKRGLGPNRYPHDIRCIWGWLLRAPHLKGFPTIFPMNFQRWMSKDGRSHRPSFPWSVYMGPPLWIKTPWHRT